MKIIFFFLLVGCAFAAPSTKDGASGKGVSNGLNAALERFRRLMLVGDPDKGIPVMDPLELETFDFDFNSTYLSMGIKSEGIHVTGLSDFIVHNVDMSMIPMAVNFEVTLPMTVIKTVFYDFYGMVFHALPIYGKGLTHFELGNFYFKGVSKVAVGLNGVYLRDLLLDINVDSMKSETSGMLGGGDIDNVINAIIYDLAPDFFNMNSRPISKAASSFVLTKINKMLDGMTLSDFIDLITG